MEDERILNPIEAFKFHHPFGRIYELPTQEGDRYQGTAWFEIMEWRVRMVCVGKKNGISKWKRENKMTFEE